MKSFICNQCNFEFNYADNATQIQCPNCGYVYTKKDNSTSLNNTVNTVVNNDYRSKGLLSYLFKGILKFILGLVLFIVVVIIIALMTDDTTDDSVSSSSDNVSNSVDMNENYDSNQESQEQLNDYQEVLEEPTSVLILDNIDYSEYKYCLLEQLDKYSEYLINDTILTVGEIGDIDVAKNEVQISIPNTYHYGDFYLAYDSNVVLSNDLVGRTVAIIGVISEPCDAYLFKSPQVNECYIVAEGTDAEAMITKTDKTLYKKFKDAEVSDKVSSTDDSALSESDFKESCKQIGASDYNDILRNPDSYNKVSVKLKGTVDQIIEGWFDSYTIYIVDDKGNKWGTTYYYKDGESHKLEGDSITVYGVLKGTTTTETVLGKQVTLPYIDIEYIK